MEAEIVDVSALAVLSRAEIDTQISTARAYPRSMVTFRQEMQGMVTLSEEVATECIFALPRGKNEDGSKKFIEGASVRFAEIALYNFGNARSGSSMIGEDKESVTCEGFFHDLEKNVAIKTQVRRKITDKYGKRFNADMVTVTVNAACALAKRNAILQGIPKALWVGFYELARKTAIGDDKTLVAKRTAMMAYFQKMNVSAETITGFLGQKSVDDITLDDLAILKGIATAIKEGAVSIDKAFVTEGEDTTRMGKAAAAVDKINKAKAANTTETAPDEMLQEVYQLIQKLADEQGDTCDDVISSITGNKITAQIDLDGKSVSYLTDIKLSLEVELAKGA
jgi:cell fate (sporulation/competence/biofilm development) regulator YmcA (YheA/YmcA/DUF963 family)